MRLYVSIRDLPQSCQPCHITRTDEMTTITVQPGAD